ncbi:MAG: hypothetical protein IH916_09195, partial [Acidobacteria bacterium]|nr:hypothetical protein [Acidobacteriota bacterium]
QLRHVPSIYPAGIYAGLGQNDRALEWLERAYEERSEVLILLKLEPIFDPPRSDPRFQSLLRRLNFPE